MYVGIFLVDLILKVVFDYRDYLIQKELPHNQVTPITRILIPTIEEIIL